MSAFNRREFVKLAGVTGLGVVAAPQVVFAADPIAPRNTDTLVVIFQRGAMDGLTAVVPYNETEYYAKRPNLAVPRPGTGDTAAIDLDGQFAFAPQMAPLKALWDRSELAVVHAAGLTFPSRSHFDAQDFMERAWLTPGQVFSGWLNRHLSTTSQTTDATFRAIGVGRALPRSMTGPAPIINLASIAAFDITSRSPRKSEMETALQTSFSGSDFLDSTGNRAFSAVDELTNRGVSTLSVENGAVYPTTTFGSQMRDLAKLLKSGLGVEAATCEIGGWDTHNNQGVGLPNLLDQFAKTLAAFHTDLGARMRNITVVTMTEFGRRLLENGSRGTDHGRASCMFVMGGGTLGKRVYGDWPTLAPNRLEIGDLRVTTDYRTVLAELLAKRCGNSNRAEVFPGFAATPALGMFTAR